MLNSAKCVGFSPQLKRLDGKYGLPPLPRVDARLHAGDDPESPLKQLQHAVTEYALVELAGKKGAFRRASFTLIRNSHHRRLR